MTTLLTLGSWLLAGGILGLSWRRGAATREAVARAAHELRGPLSAIALGLSAERRDAQVVGAADRAVTGRGAALELELRRARVALADLDELGGVRGRTGRAWRGARNGTRPGRLEAVALEALLAQSALAWEPFAELAGVELVPPPPTGARGAVVLGDPARLAQAVGNLIANAVEHGGGVVRVRCRCTERTVRVEISDRGPGLPAPVEWLAARRSRGRHGHGLHVAAGVAASHGGRLSAAPSAVGARLVLELPRLTG